jgi:outer membrane protein W
MKRSLLLAMLFVICMVGVQNAFASTEIGWRSIGGDVAFVDPENMGGAAGFGMFADLGTLAPRLHLSPQATYWSKSEGGFGVDASVSDISLTARGKYMFPVKSRSFQPYAGGGLGIHFVTAKVSIADQIIGGFFIPGMSESDTQSKVGLDMGGGFLTPLGAKTDLTGDFWYTFVSDVGNLQMSLGLSYKLGK